jgi:hypothetical protein
LTRSNLSNRINWRIPGLMSMIHLVPLSWTILWTTSTILEHASTWIPPDLIPIKQQLNQSTLSLSGSSSNPSLTSRRFLLKPSLQCLVILATFKYKKILSSRSF